MQVAVSVRSLGRAHTSKIERQLPAGYVRQCTTAAAPKRATIYARFAETVSTHYWDKFTIGIPIQRYCRGTSKI